MSEDLKQYNYQKYKEGITVDINHSIHVTKQFINGEDVAFTVHINNNVLKSWQDFKEIHRNISFIALLNHFLGQKYAILIKQESERIEDHLRRLASSSKANFRGKQGSASVKFGKVVKRIAIRSGEVRYAAEIEHELSKLKDEKEDLEKKNASLDERFNELYQSLLEAESLRRTSDEKLSGVYSNIERLKKETAHLWEYFDLISEQEGFQNCGKKVSEVKERQQRRKIRELKTYVDKALWFAETFGLHLSSVEFKDDTGMFHTMEYRTDNLGKKSYKELSDAEKEKVQQILFITDKFCISEAAYHEMTMTAGGGELPRSYLVKQCKTDLNSLCHISRTPGEAEGAELDFESELKNTIMKQVSDMSPFCAEVDITIQGWI